MPFEQAFVLSSVLLAATAFSGLVFSQSVPLWLALPTAIILMISLLHAGGVLFIRRAMAQVTVSPTLWNVLLIGAFVILLIDLTSGITRPSPGRHPLFGRAAGYQATHPSTAA